MRKTRRSMLEYCKLILSKLTFSPKLFRKEYRKSFRYLDPQEHHELKTWVREYSKTTSEKSSIHNEFKKVA